VGGQPTRLVLVRPDPHLERVGVVLLGELLELDDEPATLGVQPHRQAPDAPARLDRLQQGHPRAVPVGGGAVPEPGQQLCEQLGEAAHLPLLEQQGDLLGSSAAWTKKVRSPGWPVQPTVT
jgi:hypothetical protein